MAGQMKRWGFRLGRARRRQEQDYQEVTEAWLAEISTQEIGGARFPSHSIGTHFTLRNEAGETPALPFPALRNPNFAISLSV